MKKYVLCILLALVPTLLMAQAAGGQVKRPVNKTQTSSTASKKPVAKKQAQTMT